MKQVWHVLAAGVLVGLFTGCSAQSGAQTSASAPAQADDTSLDNIKRQVIAYVARQNRFDPADVVDFIATAKATTDDSNHPAFDVLGSFQVKTSAPSNLDEAVNAHVNGRVCMVDSTKCAETQFNHVVYFKAQARFLERLDHSQSLNVTQQSSVDKSFEVIAQEQAQSDALIKQAVGTGTLVFSFVKLEPPQVSERRLNSSCRVTLQISNQTNLPLWGINGDVIVYNHAGKALTNANNMAEEGFLKDDTIQPGQTELLVVSPPCASVDSIAKWEIKELRAKIGLGLPTAGMDASIRYSYPEWSEVVSAWEARQLPARYQPEVTPTTAAQPSTRPQAQLGAEPTVSAVATVAAATQSGGPAERHAPSFDCSLASTPTERAICSDATLSAMDFNVAKEYRALRNSASPDRSKALLDSQRDWVKKREARCQADTNCLMQMMSTRIPELRHVAT
jgi:uncharacterized protein YecT (DUF1311 family)